MKLQAEEKWVAVAALVEVGTGLVLIVRPSLFTRLLFGAPLLPAGQALGRLTGFTLFALAVACWPRQGVDGKSAAQGFILFSALTAIYLVYIGIGRGLVGPLLWPAVALHAALTVMLVRGWFAARKIDLDR